MVKTPTKTLSPSTADTAFEAGQIRIRGARQNNLQGVSVDLPRGALVAITGLSGSGKSSLAFDTLFREGQRRFLETLSGYARQFLGGLAKPDVESIEGLSPAIAVDQKSVPRGARSTVGTLTEVTDHLRVLFARAGVAHCPDCQEPVRSRTPEALAQEILRIYEGQKVMLCAPLIRDRKGSHKALFEDLRKRGFVRVRVDEQLLRLENVPELNRYQRHRIEVVVDRMVPRSDEPGRLRESLNTCLKHGEGDVMVCTDDEALFYSTERVCPGCGGDVPPLEPRLFSFNSPHGACGDCQGLGIVRKPTELGVVAEPTLTIREGALAVTKAKGGGLSFPRVGWAFLEKVASANGFNLDTPWKALSRASQEIMMEGAGEQRFADTASWNGSKFKGKVEWDRRFPGVLGALRKAVAKGTTAKQVERYLAKDACDACAGTRLKPAARSVRMDEYTFPMLMAEPVERLQATLAALDLTDRQKRIARDLLLEIERRVDFLLKVGLGYLTLERPADTLSGGEAQRIRLAAQLGAGLQGVLYVLDEPSIGLHARDHNRLLGALGDLRDAGNSVVVVEHDAATLRAADYIVDVGPGAGRDGGRIMAVGSPEEVARAETPTARLLRGEVHMPAPEKRRKGNGKTLSILGATGNNLKGVDAHFPLGTLTAVTGVSGSGKSSLVQGTLRRALTRRLGREAPLALPHDELKGWKHIHDLVAIDAAPIGRTTRSNPATYTKILGPIRDLFAALPDSRMHGYDKSRFSFNTVGGRCEACQGGGAQYVELQFLAPVTVPCDVCGGRRFQEETLAVHFKGKSIADVLNMTVEDARDFFKDHTGIHKVLDLLFDVGLGYLTLGQPSTTLSGGEAQRIKLVTHLAKKPRGHVLYLLDEPTTGLHMEDVGRLVHALQRLVDLGHSVIVIEHNLELVEAADYVLDMGPEGGNAGGELLVAGTPEDVQATKGSYTGIVLQEMADEAKAPLKSSANKTRSKQRVAAPMNDLVVEKASLHNLKGVDVRIPHRSLTVVTGPSGSGKSSLALDTIYAEGRRRFVESLSTYARQFLGNSDRPPYERIEGLGPAVAVEARGGAGHPRSTIATTTEIHDHLRVLWARAGTPRCPEHGEELKGGDASSIARSLLQDIANEGSTPKGWLVVPLVPGGPDTPNSRTEIASSREALVSAGYARLLVDREEWKLDGDLEKVPEASRVDLVVDRLSFTESSKGRLAEAIEGASEFAAGRFSVVLKDGPRLEYSTQGACTQCGFEWAQGLEPRHFSFNTLVGACEHCSGLGEVVRCDAEMLVDQPDDPLLGGPDSAITGKLGRYLIKGKGYYEMLLRAVAKSHRIPIEKKAFQDLKPEQKELILYGTGAREQYKVSFDRTAAHSEIHEEFHSEWPGLCGQVDAWHKKSEDPGWTEVLETVMSRKTCLTCEGERLAPGPRAVLVGDQRLPEFLGKTVEDALVWIGKLKVREAMQVAIAPVLSELRSRLGLLDRVGLGYLTLDRTARTLSGGEARRVRLSANLGSELVGVTYVLDEPTVGLHPRDVDRLTGALEELRDRGNTVIVVEHDPAVMRRADWIVDLGPGAGEEGGQLMAMGPPAVIEACMESSTGAYLRGELDLGGEGEDADESVRPTRMAQWPPLRLRGAKTHNLKGVDLDVPFGKITGLCGPSGSGKSSLVLDTLVPALKGHAHEGRWDSVRGLIGGDLRISVVDASPIGRTPRSVPATYTGLMDPLRALFVRTPDARLQGFTIANFSFNSSKGRCPACEGIGSTKVEMQFLADLWLVCEECDGKRYRP
ncbi:MAG: excinuclease ABC subunit A, partial [Planctomycetota bacterium]